MAHAEEAEHMKLEQWRILLPLFLMALFDGCWTIISYAAETPLTPLADTLVDRSADRIYVDHFHVPRATTPPAAQALRTVGDTDNVEQFIMSASGQGVPPSALDPVESLAAVHVVPPIRSRLLPARELATERFPPASPRR